MHGHHISFRTHQGATSSRLQLPKDIGMRCTPLATNYAAFASSGSFAESPLVSSSQSSGALLSTIRSHARVAHLDAWKMNLGSSFILPNQ